MTPTPQTAIAAFLRPQGGPAPDGGPPSTPPEAQAAFAAMLAPPSATAAGTVPDLGIGGTNVPSLSPRAAVGIVGGDVGRGEGIATGGAPDRALGPPTSGATVGTSLLPPSVAGRVRPSIPLGDGVPGTATLGPPSPDGPADPAAGFARVLPSPPAGDAVPDAVKLVRPSNGWPIDGRGAMPPEGAPSWPPGFGTERGRGGAPGAVPAPPFMAAAPGAGSTAEVIAGLLDTASPDGASRSGDARLGAVATGVGDVGSGAPKGAPMAAVALGLKTVRLGDEGTTRIELSPRGLGDIEVDLRYDEARRLQVVLRADNAAVLSAMRQDRDALAAVLREGGMDMGEADLSFESFEDRSSRGRRDDGDGHSWLGADQQPIERDRSVAEAAPSHALAMRGLDILT